MSAGDGTGRGELDRLRRERDQAWAHARTLEHELGEVRGRVKRLELVLYRRTRRRQLLAGLTRRWQGGWERIRGR